MAFAAVYEAMDVNLSIAAVGNASTLAFNWTFQYNETWVFHRGTCVGLSVRGGSCGQQVILGLGVSTVLEDRSNRSYFSPLSPIKLPGAVFLSAKERCSTTSCRGGGDRSQHGQQNFVLSVTDMFSIPGGMHASHRYVYLVHLTLQASVYNSASRAAERGTHLVAAFRPISGAACVDLNSITWS